LRKEEGKGQYFRVLQQDGGFLKGRGGSAVLLGFTTRRRFLKGIGGRAVFRGFTTRRRFLRKEEGEGQHFGKASIFGFYKREV
jgi:hypothetical protein